MTINKSRRSFISFIATNVAVSLFITAAGIRQTKAALNLVLPSQHQFQFVDVSGLGPAKEGPFVENNYYPLHNKKNIINDAIPVTQRRAAENLLKQDFEKMDLEWHDSFTTVWTSQHYGVPDTSELSQTLLKHCKNMQIYLYHNLHGLVPEKPSWNLLSHENYPDLDEKSFKAFVGQFTYIIIRVDVVNAYKEIQELYLINARPLERSINFISSDATTFIPNKSTIYIIPGLTSLCSPCSELLHLSLNEPTLRYAKELTEKIDPILAQEQARIFGETINEAISISITRQYLQTYKYLDRLEQLGTLAQHMRNYLPDLDIALAFCHDYGVQECFTEYKKCPGLVKSQIEQYRQFW